MRMQVKENEMEQTISTQSLKKKKNCGEREEEGNAKVGFLAIVELVTLTCFCTIYSPKLRQNCGPTFIPVKLYLWWPITKLGRFPFIQSFNNGKKGQCKSANKSHKSGNSSPNFRKGSTLQYSNPEFINALWQKKLEYL
jgi:hypothetical protein